MPSATQSFFQRWFVTTLGVLLATAMVDGIAADNFVALAAASLLLGILNAFLRPVLLLAALPLLILTLGLFTIVINSLLLYWVGLLVKGFYVADFWSAVKGSILIGIASFFANGLIGRKEPSSAPGFDPGSRPRPSSTAAPRPTPPPNTGSGPVIDV